jgi:NADH:ubiquinone oxidoreductase subunit 5 (subunit L)/multisubunit Na+/H+ antiporter MnhA subunit
MKTTNKIKIANLTTWTMVVTICVVALFFIGFMTTQAFDLNVFTKGTSEFIFSFIGFAAVLVVCSAILNISLNIGIIADSRSQDLNDSSKSNLTMKFVTVVLGLVFALMGFLFLGDFLTRQNEKNKLTNEATDIVTRYSESINKISAGLSDSSKVKEIPNILKFLSNQKENFPSVSLITSDKFEGQRTYLEISQWENEESLKKPFYGNSFYKCEIQDCDYLNAVFNGKTASQYFWTAKDDYKLYFPFVKDKKKFILLFTKYERHGKMGSY